MKYRKKGEEAVKGRKRERRKISERQIVKLKTEWLMEKNRKQNEMCIKIYKI